MNLQYKFDNYIPMSTVNIEQSQCKRDRITKRLTAIQASVLDIRNLYREI